MPDKLKTIRRFTMLGKGRSEGDASPNKRTKTEKNERQLELLDSVEVLREQYSALTPHAFKEKIYKVFFIDVGAYAIMSNHHHLALHANEGSAHQSTPR